MILSITLDKKIGGIATSLISYSKALDLIGEQHWVILPIDAPAIEGIKELSNVRVIAIKKTLLKFHIYTKFYFYFELRDAVRKSKWIFLHNSKLVKYFTFFHYKTGLLNHSGKLRNTLHNSYNIFITQRGLDRFQKKYPKNNSKNIVIQHCFENKVTQNTFSEICDGSLRVISGGRFVEKKGFKDIIEAARLLQKRQSKIQIKLYGSGPLESEFSQMIKSYQLNNIVLPGWVPSLDEAFLESDVFCIPSLEEPFGLIIGEAMMYGLPIVSTKTDGALELFGSNPEEKGGMLVDFSSPEQLVEAMIAMEDNVFRKKVAINAKGNIQTNFSLEKLSKDLKNLFR
tara:strand:+ start:481 stop:1506 length:1026 start_codon:yes stop_codon:yes gene_type:complete